MAGTTRGQVSEQVGGHGDMACLGTGERDIPGNQEWAQKMTKNLQMGCGHMKDEEFLRAFEERRLQPGTFHHADHLRLAWLCVNHYGERVAENYLLEGIRTMAQKAGAPEKFLYTTTVAWTRLVAEAIRNDSVACSFEGWIERHPGLLDRQLLLKHYSKERLDSAEARGGWLEPDLLPFSCAKTSTGST